MKNKDPSTFLKRVLIGEKIREADFARLMGWSYQKVGYLTSKNCQGFPFNQLGKLRHALRMSERKLMDYLNSHFAQQREKEEKQANQASEQE